MPTSEGTPAPDTGSSTSAASTAIDSSAPVSAGSDVSSNPASAADASATPAAHEAFGWDQWDGSTFDSFPDDVRPWAERLGKHYSSRDEAQRADQKKLEELYNALINDLSDPRVNEYQEKEKTWTESQRVWESEKSEYLKQIEARDRAIQAYTDQVSRQFQEQHPWIFDGGEKQKMAVELLREDFDHWQLPELLKLSPATLANTRRIHKELLSTGARNVGSHAIRLAMAESRPNEPGAAAALVADVGQTAPQSSAAKAAPAVDSDFDAFKMHVARRRFAGRG